MAGVDGERYAHRLAPAGAGFVAAGVLAGGGPGAGLAAAGAGLLVAGCASAADGFLLLGPPAARDLRRFGRSGGWRKARVAVAVAAAAVLGLCVAAGGVRAGARTFTAVCGAAAVVAVPVAAGRLAAAVVAADRERKRLDFLLTTDLRGRELVVGPAVVRLAAVGMVLLAPLPLVAAAGYVGGVPPAVAGWATAAVAAVAVGAAAVAGWASADSPNPGVAAIVAVAVAVLYVTASGALFLAAGWPWPSPSCT